MSADPNDPDDFERQEIEYKEDDDRLLEEGWPPALVKARDDPFDYACGLRTGAVIRFGTCEDLGHGWVRLLPEPAPADDGHDLPYPCPRGVDVRVDDIVWCADAPEGS
jgi:hypothetical protein